MVSRTLTDGQTTNGYKTTYDGSFLYQFELKAFIHKLSSLDGTDYHLVRNRPKIMIDVSLATY